MAIQKNKRKKNEAQSNLARILDGVVKTVVNSMSAENPKVMKFGIRPVRKSKTEMTGRYKRHKFCKTIKNLILLYLINIGKKKKKKINS